MVGAGIQHADVDKYRGTIEHTVVVAPPIGDFFVTSSQNTKKKKNKTLVDEFTLCRDASIGVINITSCLTLVHILLLKTYFTC